MAPTVRLPEARFWDKVRYNPTNRCWEWTGRLVKGHGRFDLTSRQATPSHRFAYELMVGHVPDDLFVCHHCDNRKCVKPDHLFLGTHQDNMDDMVSKGRQPHPKGTANGHAKLDDDKVRELRALRQAGYSLQYLADRYGVSASRISDAARGATWSHISLEKEN